MPTPTLSASEPNQMRCATDPPDLMLSGSSSSRTKPQRRYVARDSGGPQGGRGKAGQGFTARAAARAVPGARAARHTGAARWRRAPRDRKSTRLNSSHLVISYAVFCLEKKNKEQC